MRRLAWLLMLGLSLSLSLARPAAADDERARALELGREALRLYNGQRWVEAFERFESADRLVHSPVFVLYMARAQKNLGALLRSRELYRRVEAEELDEDAPGPWHDAVRDAAEERIALDARIPRLRITVEGGSGAMEVWLDDRLLRAAEVGEAMRLDPGRYRVVVRQNGVEVARRHLELVEGREEKLPVVLTPPPPAVVPAAPQPAPAPAPIPARAPRDDRKALRVAGITTLAVGGALTVVGIALGIVAIGMDAELEEACEDQVCPLSLSDDVDAYHQAGHTATGMLVAGGVLVGGGIIMTAIAAQPTESAEGLRLSVSGAF